MNTLTTKRSLLGHHPTVQQRIFTFTLENIRAFLVQPKLGSNAGVPIVEPRL